MKKVFFLSIFLSATFIPNLCGAPVTIKVCGPGEGEIAKSFTTELIENAEGKYTITDFLNSGSSVTFSFDPNIAIGTNSTIKLHGNIKVEDNTWYHIMTTEGDYATAKLYDIDSDEMTEICPFYIYNTGSPKSYTYIKHLDKTSSGYEYCARFTVSGWESSYVESEWYYLYMYFNTPSNTGITDINSNDLNESIQYFNLNGQRVNNPANGIFVRKQGSKVEKVVIR